MPEQQDEYRTKTCRACGDSFRYPVPKTPATRFYCESCAGLPEEVRALFEKYNRRIKALTLRLEKLEQGDGGAASRPSEPAS